MKTAVLWSQPDCQFCRVAKTFLLTKGYSYIEKMIGERYTKKDLMEAVPGARSVPQIFIDGEYVGGYQDMLSYFKAK